MKIKTKVLTAFLKKTRMSGEQKLSEAIFRFEKDGLKINANSSVKQSRVMGWLRTSVFEGYEELGNICLNDLDVVIKVLERFGDSILLKKEGNLLTVKGENKKVDIELVAESFLDTDTGEPKLEFEETLNVPATALKGVFADVTLNKDAVMTLKTEDKKFKILNTGKYKFSTEIVAPTCKGGTSVKMGQALIDSIINLDGNLEISMKSNYPIKVLEKTENSRITIIVAPRVDDEESTENKSTNESVMSENESTDDSSEE